MKRKKKKTLADIPNKRLRELLQDFDDSAQSWADQKCGGSGSSAVSAEKNYHASIHSLVKYLLRAEARRRRGTKTQ